MTISKAIEILELNLKETGKRMPGDCRDALLMAVEALKRTHRARQTGLPIPYAYLPGETRE